MNKCMFIYQYIIVQREKVGALYIPQFSKFIQQYTTPEDCCVYTDNNIEIS